MLLSLVSVCSFSQKVTSGYFEYPMKSGDGKWEQMNSVEERITALQIPEAILTSIPTERLLDICLDFPYLLDVLFYDDYQKGLEALKKEFNGFNELFNRKDLGKCALAKCKNFSTQLDQLNGKRDIEKGQFSFQSFVLELIIAQDNVIESFSDDDEKVLLDLTIQNMELKTNHADIFSNINIIPSYLLYAKKALIDKNFKFKDTKQKEDVMEFVQRPIFIDDSLIECVEQYIKNK